MAEEHALLFNVACEVIAPLREDVNKETPSRLEDAYRLIDPREGPLQVIPPLEGILQGSTPIVLPEIEGRVGEDTFDGVILERSKKIEAIRCVE
jgi:hypothetical protein